MTTIKQVQAQAREEIRDIDATIKAKLAEIAELRARKGEIRADVKAMIERIKAEREAKAKAKSEAKVENKAKAQARDEAKAVKYANWLREYMAKRRPVLAIAAE